MNLNYARIRIQIIMERQRPGIMEIGVRTIGAIVVGGAVYLAKDRGQSVYADTPTPVAGFTQTFTPTSTPTPDADATQIAGLYKAVTAEAKELERAREKATINAQRARIAQEIKDLESTPTATPTPSTTPTPPETMPTTVARATEQQKAIVKELADRQASKTPPAPSPTMSPRPSATPTTEKLGKDEGQGGGIDIPGWLWWAGGITIGISIAYFLTPYGRMATTWVRDGARRLWRRRPGGPGPGEVGGGGAAGEGDGGGDAVENP